MTRHFARVRGGEDGEFSRAFAQALDRIDALRDEHPQEEIGEKLGRSRNQVARHVGVLENVMPEVLDLAREHQEGRGTDDVPNGTFDFTEGWFRNSELYDLTDEWTGRTTTPMTNLPI